MNRARLDQAVLLWMRAESEATAERLRRAGWVEEGELWRSPCGRHRLPLLAADDARRELAPTAARGTTEAQEE